MKYHLKMGHEVSLITARWEYGHDYRLFKSPQVDYYIDGIHVLRLDIRSIKDSIYFKFKRYYGVKEALTKLHPDVLFIHGCQFLDIGKIVSYLKSNPYVSTYVDNHADFSNSGRSIVSKILLHKIIWRSCLQSISPYVKKFYGVLPARVSFLVDMYNAPADKCELLLMGGDDDLIVPAIDKREQTRLKYNISSEDFLIVTGGKIDKAKAQTILLLRAAKQISSIKLIMFGPIDSSLRDEIESMIDGMQIQSLGWADAQMAYDLFAAADLVIFPGRHSVYWEQVAAIGIPMVVKFWEGTNHIDRGGNVCFLYSDSVEEIKDVIMRILNDNAMYLSMLECARNHRNEFLYSDIARKSIL